jgi:hypothetical protein
MGYPLFGRKTFEDKPSFEYTVGLSKIYDPSTVDAVKRCLALSASDSACSEQPLFVQDIKFRPTNGVVKLWSPEPPTSLFACLSCEDDDSSWSNSKVFRLHLTNECSNLEQSQPTTSPLVLDFHTPVSLLFGFANEDFLRCLDSSLSCRLASAS